MFFSERLAPLGVAGYQRMTLGRLMGWLPAGADAERAALSTTSGVVAGVTPKLARPRARKWSRKIVVDFQTPDLKPPTSDPELVFAGADNDLDTGSLDDRVEDNAAGGSSVDDYKCRKRRHH